MPAPTRSMFPVRVLLTVTALEFFGPIVRDTNATHLLHPAWVGHARLHLVWLLGFMLLSGIANLNLVWGRRSDVRDLWLSVAWQSSNLGGFWIAAALAPRYGGLVTVPGEHIHVFGWDENVLVFAILSTIMATAVLLLGLGAREATRAAR